MRKPDYRQAIPCGVNLISQEIQYVADSVRLDALALSGVEHGHERSNRRQATCEFIKLRRGHTLDLGTMHRVLHVAGRTPACCY